MEYLNCHFIFVVSGHFCLPLPVTGLSSRKVAEQDEKLCPKVVLFHFSVLQMM